jgi:hypothetical protein
MGSAKQPRKMPTDAIVEMGLVTVFRPREDAYRVSSRSAMIGGDAPAGEFTFPYVGGLSLGAITDGSLVLGSPVDDRDRRVDERLVEINAADPATLTPCAYVPTDRR